MLASHSLGGGFSYLKIGSLWRLKFNPVSRSDCEEISGIQNCSWDEARRE